MNFIRIVKRILLVLMCVFPFQGILAELVFNKLECSNCCNAQDPNGVTAVIVSISPGAEAEENNLVNSIFTISIDNALSDPLTISLSLSGTATDGDDMTSMATSVIIPSGSLSVTTPVTVSPDDIAEGNESVILTLGASSGAASGVTVTNNTTSSATVNILDDDTDVEVSIAGTSAANESGLVNGVFTISLTKVLSSDLTVPLSISATSNATDGSDMETMATSVIIPSGSLSVTTLVRVLSDDIAEGIETVVLELGTATGAPDGVTINIGTSSATVNILDDDDDSVELNIAGTSNANESGLENGVFTISLTKVLSSDLTVPLSLSATSNATDGSDMETMATSVIIPSGSLSVTTLVRVLSDDIAEGLETVVLDLGTATGAPDGVTINRHKRCQRIWFGKWRFYYQSD